MPGLRPLALIHALTQGAALAGMSRAFGAFRYKVELQKQKLRVGGAAVLWGLGALRADPRAMQLRPDGLGDSGGHGVDGGAGFKNSEDLWG